MKWKNIYNNVICGFHLRFKNLLFVKNKKIAKQF